MPFNPNNILPIPIILPCLTLKLGLIEFFINLGIISSTKYFGWNGTNKDNAVDEISLICGSTCINLLLYK